jgi:hypothetical protein
MVLPGHRIESILKITRSYLHKGRFLWYYRDIESRVFLRNYEMMLTQRGDFYGITGTLNREYSQNYEMMHTQRGDFYGIIGTSNREYSQNYEMMLTQRGDFMVLPGHRIESTLKIRR